MKGCPFGRECPGQDTGEGLNISDCELWDGNKCGFIEIIELLRAKYDQSAKTTGEAVIREIEEGKR